MSLTRAFGSSIHLLFLFCLCVSVGKVMERCLRRSQTHMMKLWRSSKIRWQTHHNRYPSSAPISHTHTHTHTHTFTHKHTSTNMKSDICLMSQGQKKPQSSLHKEEGGLKVSKTIKSRHAGPTSSTISPAPPPGKVFTY